MVVLVSFHASIGKNYGRLTSLNVERMVKYFPSFYGDANEEINPGILFNKP